MTHLSKGLKYPFENVGIQPKITEPGFGEFDVPEMPAYVQSYSKRGNTFDGDTTPVYQQARFGNKTGRGGMEAYLSQVEDPTYFESMKVKKGNTGVYEIERYTPGYDWRGGFGIASLASNKNYAMSTRGGQLRKGGPKRSDVMDRPNAWFEQARPGISHSRYTQNNDNYSGLFEYKRLTPIVQTDNDMLDLREMIEHNPYHISSYAAEQAKKIYDKEVGTGQDMAFAAYRDDIEPSDNKSRFPTRVQDKSIEVKQEQYNKYRLMLDPNKFRQNF